MASNITLNEQTGTAGAILWTEEITGPKHAQIMKLADGSAGATTMIVAGNGSAADALRVTLANDGTGVLAQLGNISATVNVVVGAGTANIGSVNDISATVNVVVGAGTSNIGIINNISATVSAVLGAGSANIGSINDISATVSAVLGAGSANIGSVNNISATVAVSNSGTFAVQEDGAALTALQLLDNTVFADDAAFTLASSSVNMAGAIRDDTLSTLTAIEGDATPLRVNSTGALHVTGGGGGTEYAVDDALGATPTGTVPLAIRDDTLSTLTPAEGDAVALRVNSTGALHVTGGGGGTQYSVDDAAPTVVTMAGVVRDDTLTTLTEVDGDATLLRVSSTGALHVTGGGGGTEYTEDVATPNPIVGTATMMERDDALSTLTPIEGDWVGMRASAEGALWTQDFNSDGILADTTAIKTAVETIDNAVSGSGFNITQLNGVNVTMGNGVAGTGVQRVTIASDSTGVLAQVGNISASVNVVIGSGSTLNGLGKIDGISATANVVIGAGTAEIGSIASISATVATSLAPVNVSRQIDLDESEDSINSAASTLYFIHAMNLTAAVAYLHLYDSNTATVNVGTTTPTMTFPLPTQGDTNGAGFVLSIDRGITFSTGIIAAVTTGITGSAGPAANGVMATFGYL